MISPFPGMDPYIESCGLWGDFYGNLIHKLQEHLADTVPPRYLVRGGERSYVTLEETTGPTRHQMIPDVKITTSKERPKRSRPTSGLALAEPDLRSLPGWIAP